MRRRQPGALLHLSLIGLLVLAGLWLAACGGEDRAAPDYDVLTPSPGATAGKPHASTSPSAVTTPSAAQNTSSKPTPSDAPSPSSTSTKPTGDAVIRRDILARIASEPGLRGFDFTVFVNDGTVVIRGRVRTEEQKATAERICLETRGVAKVLSAIEVSTASGY